MNRTFGISKSFVFSVAVVAVAAIVDVVGAPVGIGIMDSPVSI